MIKWRPFIFECTEYDLSHLHPFELEFRQLATQDKPEKVYLFEVCFSLHCFTFKDLGNSDAALFYSDARETRVFCFDRYELSKGLPKIVRTIFERHCYHTGHSNYFTVELINRQGETVEYQVYFTVSKSSQRKGLLNLYIQSAYPNTRQHKHKPKKPIQFRVIAHNTLTGKIIKPPA